jgi:hypothetical protein
MPVDAWDREQQFPYCDVFRKTRGREARQRAIHADQIRILPTEEAEYLTLVGGGVSRRSARLGDPVRPREAAFVELHPVINRAGSGHDSSTVPPSIMRQSIFYVLCIHPSSSLGFREEV